MKKVLSFILFVAMVFATCSALAEGVTGFASAPGFSAHGDVAFASATLDAEDKLVALDINEYYGIRSVGRIINNITKASDEELAKLDAIPEADKVLSEDGKYAAWKYLKIDNRLFECRDAGKNLYVEIGENAEITDLQAYLLENTDWWCNAMATAAETGAVLKTAAEGDTVACEVNGVKLAVYGPLTSFYGALTKMEGYSKNFSPAGTTTAWAESVQLLDSYILAQGGVSEEMLASAQAEDKKAFLDAVSGATFGSPEIYVNVAKLAIENAKSGK